MPTPTSNYGWLKPDPAGSTDQWGDLLNADLDAIDGAVHSISINAGVSSWNTRTGAVTLTLSDVTNVGGAPLASPVFTGVPTAPTVTPSSDSSAALATTAFVQSAVSGATAGVVSWNSRTGSVTMQLSDVTGVGGAAASSIPAASSTTPIMDGTAAVGAGTTWARADHVHPTDTSRYAASNPSGYITSAALAPYAPLASPTFTGAPSLPTGSIGVTQTAGNNSTALATTAFVTAAVGAGLPDAPSDGSTYGRNNGAWTNTFDAGVY